MAIYAATPKQEETIETFLYVLKNEDNKILDQRRFSSDKEAINFYQFSGFLNNSFRKNLKVNRNSGVFEIILS